MVPSMLIKEPGCRTRSRLTEKLAKVKKNVCAPCYMATPEEKQIYSYTSENGMTNVFLKEYSSGDKLQDKK